MGNQNGTRVEFKGDTFLNIFHASAPYFLKSRASLSLFIKIKPQKSSP